MTIAMCYVSPEGVVLGADSTSTNLVNNHAGKEDFHYFNHNQKLFQVGEESALGIVTWGLGCGLGCLGNVGHRTAIARLADKF